MSHFLHFTTMLAKQPANLPSFNAIHISYVRRSILLSAVSLSLSPSEQIFQQPNGLIIYENLTL